MSDIMRSMPFGQIMSWIITEHRLDGSIFGVRKQVAHTDHRYMPIFNESWSPPTVPPPAPTPSWPRILSLPTPPAPGSLS